jgi:hypothetical protein
MVRAAPPQTAWLATVNDRDDEIAPPLLHEHHHEAAGPTSKRSKIAG